MTIPLLRFLQTQFENTWARRALTLTMAMLVISAIGCHSRGALLAIIATTGPLWWRDTGNRLRNAVLMPDDLMMTSEQVRGLRAAGMTIGAHTVSHPILARLPASDARREIENGKRQLEDIVGSPVRLFAYPNGRPGVDYHADTVELVKAAGFHAAFSTAWGVATVGSDPMQLPRFTPWDRTPRRFALRMLHNMRPQAAQPSPSGRGTAAA